MKQKPCGCRWYIAWMFKGGFQMVNGWRYCPPRRTTDKTGLGKQQESIQETRSSAWLKQEWDTRHKSEVKPHLMDESQDTAWPSNSKRVRGRVNKVSKKRQKNMTLFFFFLLQWTHPDTGRNRDETFQNLASASG